MKLAKWSLLAALCSTGLNDSYGAVTKGRGARKPPQQVEMVTAEVISSRYETSELLARQLASFSLTTITNAPSKAPSNAPSQKPIPKISVAAPVTYYTKAPVPKTTSTTSAPATYYYTKAPVPKTTSTTSAPVTYYYTKAPVPKTTSTTSAPVTYYYTKAPVPKTTSTTSVPVTYYNTKAPVPKTSTTSAPVTYYSTKAPVPKTTGSTLGPISKSKKPKGVANTFGSGTSGSSTSFNSSTSSSSGGFDSSNMNYPLNQINPGAVTTGGTVKPNVPPGQDTTGVGSGIQYTVIGGNPPQTGGLPDQNGSATYTTLPSQINIINTGGTVTEPQNSGSPGQGGSVIYTTLPSQMNNVVPGGNPTTSSGQTIVISTPVEPKPKGMFSNNGS
jgi:hypothetical protein